MYMVNVELSLKVWADNSQCCTFVQRVLAFHHGIQYARSLSDDRILYKAKEDVTII